LTFSPHPHIILISNAGRRAIGQQIHPIKSKRIAKVTVVQKGAIASRNPSRKQHYCPLIPGNSSQYIPLVIKVSTRKWTLPEIPPYAQLP
jgi:hypothetical protein